MDGFLVCFTIIILFLHPISFVNCCGIWLVLSWHISSWRKSCGKWAFWGVFYALLDPLSLYSMHLKRCLLVLYKRYGNWPFNLVCFLLSGLHSFIVRYENARGFMIHALFLISVFCFVLAYSIPLVHNIGNCRDIGLGSVLCSPLWPN